MLYYNFDNFSSIINSSCNFIICKLKFELRKKHYDLIVIDYLQLLSASNAQSRIYELENIINNLKIFAKKYETCFLILSQFNRESEKQEKMP